MKQGLKVSIPIQSLVQRYDSIDVDFHEYSTASLMKFVKVMRAP